MEDQVRKEFFDLLRFPSIGAEKVHFKDCLSCASWLRRLLEKNGFSAELLYPDLKATELPPPVLFAERPGSVGASTVLFYGHYDVQPVDPVSAWETPPFEPTVKSDRIYGRGANDDKGQLFAFFCGIRDFLSSASGPVPTIKVLLDGQEESHSEALIAMAPDLAERLAADVLLVCDTSAAVDLRPAIVAGLRGVGSLTVRLSGPNRDLHSGEYGGIAPNPAQGMAQLLATLHNPDGAIAVAGFRDGVEPPTHDELAAAESAAPGELAYTEDMGCEPVGGQMGKTIVQRNSFEPTIEVNGIHSGYGGPGSKTVIPAEAVAKLSVRLVPGQSPCACFDALRAHLENNCPRGLRLTIDEACPGLAGFRLPLASPLFRLATEILAEMDPRGPVFRWEGASIPVLSVLREVSGAAPLMVGWGQSEDHIHSPNESYSFRQFEAARTWAKKILSAL